MKTRVNDLSETRAEQFKAHFDELWERISERVDAILSRIETPGVRQIVANVAFSTNDTLLKRSVRPKPEIFHLMEQLCDIHDLSPDIKNDLLEFTILVTEYFDIYDDIADGDVDQEDLSKVTLVHSILGTLIMKKLPQLDDSAVKYWTNQTLVLSECVYFEMAYNPHSEVYLDVVDRQSKLFGGLTGLVPVVDGAKQVKIDEASTLGEIYFMFEQFLLDLEQKIGGDDDPWNAWHLIDNDDIRSVLEAWRRQALDLTAQFPDENRQLIEAMFATDIDEFRNELRA